MYLYTYKFNLDHPLKYAIETVAPRKHTESKILLILLPFICRSVPIYQPR